MLDHHYDVQTKMFAWKNILVLLNGIIFQHSWQNIFNIVTENTPKVERRDQLSYPQL